MYVQCLRVAFPLLAAALALAGSARGQHFDIFLARPATGSQTVVGGADVSASIFDDVTRVFEGDMGDVGEEFNALEPGVDHPNRENPVGAYPSSADGLEVGDVLRLFERDFCVGGIVDDLFYWNGVGAVSFTSALADFSIAGGDPLSGTAGVGGAFHDHPFFVIDSDDEPGIYLASAYGVVDGFDPSEPVYLVFATGEEFEEVHEQAAEYVYATLVVPEPASLSLAAVACGAIVTLGRRKRSSAHRK